MTTYRFKTRVSKTGVIKVPSGSHLLDKEVEVVLTNLDNVDTEEISASEFVDKWGGFLAGQELKDQRYNYLSEKYK